jgi:hypothetical protein
LAECASSENRAFSGELKITANGKRLIKKVYSQSGWTDAGQGWEGKKETLRLVGWSRSRTVVVLRRRLKNCVTLTKRDKTDQLSLSLTEIGAEEEVYEHAILVTSMDEKILGLAQLYRDRGDAENPFDELKHQWGWAGFTARDLARSQLMAQFIALVYNWWNLFARLAEPDPPS